MIEALLPIYEAGRQNEEDHRQEIQPTPLEIAYHTAWKKLDEYYKKTDATHQIYAAAVLIYPQFRKAYFQDNWKDSWMRTMVSGVKRHWKEVYQPLDDVDKDNDLSDQSPPHKQARHQLDFLDKHLSKKAPVITKAHTEFDAYINSPVVELGDKAAIFGWLRRTSTVPPSIRQMCIDLLSIPAMSAEVERVFSFTKRAITTDRNRLDDDTIGKLELLKYWWQHDLVAPIV